jgi:hypothetical protein
MARLGCVVSVHMVINIRLYIIYLDPIALRRCLPFDADDDNASDPHVWPHLLSRIVAVCTFTAAPPNRLRRAYHQNNSSPVLRTPSQPSPLAPTRPHPLPIPARPRRQKLCPKPLLCLQPPPRARTQREGTRLGRLRGRLERYCRFKCSRWRA